MPVLFLTGHPGYRADDMPAFGEDEVLQKPFTAQQLLAAVRRAVARRKR